MRNFKFKLSCLIQHLLVAIENVTSPKSSLFAQLATVTVFWDTLYVSRSRLEIQKIRSEKNEEIKEQEEEMRKLRDDLAKLESEINKVGLDNINLSC